MKYGTLRPGIAIRATAWRDVSGAGVFDAPNPPIASYERNGAAAVAIGRDGKTVVTVAAVEAKRGYRRATVNDGQHIIREAESGRRLLHEVDRVACAEIGQYAAEFQRVGQRKLRVAG